MRTAKTFTIPAAKPAVIQPEAPKMRKAKTVVDPITPIEPLAAKVDEPSPFERFQGAMRAAADRFLADTNTASWQRRLVAFVVSAVTCFAVGWMVGMLANLIVATAFVSASMFLTLLTFTLAVLVAMWLGAEIGPRVNDFVISLRFGSMTKRVGGWFNSKPVTA